MYLCIDMKSFFASVECALRGLNPMKTPLVVADIKRGNGAIVLAVSTYLKDKGVKNRCRIYEIPKSIKFIVAKPRMKSYIKYAKMIHSIFLKYVGQEDIHTYSIDEAFLYVKPYLEYYNLTVHALAIKITSDISDTLGIYATCGAGDNMYLSKVALDILAKKNGGYYYLSSKTFQEKLWNHTNLTDFWQIGIGTKRHLNKLGLYTLKDIAYSNLSFLRREFGVLADEIYEHAWGIETVNISDVNSYNPTNKSISRSQILFSDYTKEKAIIPLLEMIYSVCIDMCLNNIDSKGISFFVGYSKDVDGGFGQSITFPSRSRNYLIVSKLIKKSYEKNVLNLPIRRLGISFFDVAEIKNRQMNLFDDDDEKYISLCKCIGNICNIYGRNSIFQGSALLEESTVQERNKFIGGHNSE